MNNLAHELADAELDRVCGGSSELQMIKLQSVMLQRQMIVQMTTNMFRAMNQAAGGIIRNIK
jgi:hypothetical protein